MKSLQRFSNTKDTSSCIACTSGNMSPSHRTGRMLTSPSLTNRMETAVCGNSRGISLHRRESPGQDHAQQVEHISELCFWKHCVVSGRPDPRQTWFLHRPQFWTPSTLSCSGNTSKLGVPPKQWRLLVFQRGEAHFQPTSYKLLILFMSILLCSFQENAL